MKLPQASQILLDLGWCIQPPPLFFGRYRATIKNVELSFLVEANTRRVFDFRVVDSAFLKNYRVKNFRRAVTLSMPLVIPD
jgi:hypothetical protein